MSTQVDMLVGDIYGDRDYSSIGLSATTIASSFGKVVSQVRAASILPQLTVVSPPCISITSLLRTRHTSASAFEAERLCHFTVEASEPCYIHHRFP